MPADSEADRAVLARRLIRTSDRAALGTSLDGSPYVSLIIAACDMDASPLLLLSDLAQHTRNLAANPSASLLFDGTGDYPDPLTGPRLTVLGRAERCEDPRAAARFAARHPSSAGYAGFADFHLYRVTVERGHLVAGFGRISWVEATDLRFSTDAAALAASEAEIVEHMNTDHADAVALYAAKLLGRPGAGWQMTGIDPEGIDLRLDGEIARLDFAEPVLTPAQARAALVELVQAARKMQRN
jgi:heme iron utilization protein